MRGDTFDHFLPEFDKPWVIHLRENLLLFYKPLHLEAQQLSTRIEVRRTATSFPLSGSPKVYRTQGGSGQRYSLSSNPAIKIQEVSCVPNTPNTLVRCIGAVGDILSGYPHSSSLTRVAHFGLELCFTGGPVRERRQSPIQLREDPEDLPT